MRRLLPRSLLGQVTLAVALTLFVLQGVNGILAYRIEKERSETALVNILGLRFLASARFGERPLEVRVNPRRDLEQMRDRSAEEVINGEARRRSRPNARRLLNTDLMRSESFEILPADVPRPDLEERLAETLRENGRTFSELKVVERQVSDDPVAMRFLRRLAMRRGIQDRDLPLTIAVAGLTEGGDWEVVRAPVRELRGEYGPLFPLLRAAGLTLILSFVLWLILRRLTGPLAQLTRQTERFSASPGHYEPLEPRGPQDVQRLITAHNTMETRIGALLDEKDVMLGAIGHDLKTPLAALRVRIENIPDDSNRARMAETIEEITHTLDDILALARVGRAYGVAERTDIAALAASVVEEFEDLGEPVEMGTLEKAAALARVNWLKRGLRNLVTNALRYAGDARVSVVREDGFIVLRVDDNGPGIPADRIADMLEPFARGEASRNRATGGAGLGLTLARAVAEQHGGTLSLAGRPSGGLRAEIRLPA